ncbi:hypothetical protein ACTWP5_04345 [Streptomyces sp. 4N509B]|uniref:hypothetical protein n=1 Tax=Streptomyces sp. 4N509B TaxID=3457413 RepID=UPI003FD4CE9C
MGSDEDAEAAAWDQVWIVSEALRQAAELAAREGVTLTHGGGFEGYQRALTRLSDETLTEILALVCHTTASLEHLAGTCEAWGRSEQVDWNGDLSSPVGSSTSAITRGADAGESEQ